MLRRAPAPHFASARAAAAGGECTLTQLKLTLFFFFFRCFLHGWKALSTCLEGRARVERHWHGPGLLLSFHPQNPMIVCITLADEIGSVSN